MPDTSTATYESHDPCERDNSPPSDCRQFGMRAGGLATYYRLRCSALETTVSTLEAELDRKERRAQQIRDRYEELLQGRERTCDRKPVFTR